MIGFVPALKAARRAAVRAAKHVSDEGPISDCTLLYLGPKPTNDFEKAGLRLQATKVILPIKAVRWARTAALETFVQVMHELGHGGWQLAENYSNYNSVDAEHA